MTKSKSKKTKPKTKSDKSETSAKPRRGVEVLIEELNGSLWAAAMDNGRLEGLEVDPGVEQVRWGSIYWAKVARIDAAQDAAFVNLDGTNIGILYNADVRTKNKDGTWKKGGDVAIGKILRPGQMIAVQAKSAYLPKDPSNERPGDKNPKVSMHIVLPGRYLIYSPTDQTNRVSQRIRDKTLRKQMMEMLSSMKNTSGFILRAAAANLQTDFLHRESHILKLTWEQMNTHFIGEEPSLIMLGPDAIQRMLSDLASKSIEKIEVTSPEHYAHTTEWCEIFAPDLIARVDMIELKGVHADMGLFEMRDIIGQIESLFQAYTVLPSGAPIIIQETAALTAIDVNTGSDERGHLAVNIESAKEIARQLRLRNLGGTIMIDFLRMKGKGEYDRLLKALDEYFIENDPCTVQIHGISKTGFIEVTRQRRTPPLMERFESSLQQ